MTTEERMATNHAEKAQAAEHFRNYSGKVGNAIALAEETGKKHKLNEIDHSIMDQKAMRL